MPCSKKRVYLDVSLSLSVYQSRKEFKFFMDRSAIGCYSMNEAVSKGERKVGLVNRPGKS
jgi:hypothetical protein